MDRPRNSLCIDCDAAFARPSPTRSSSLPCWRPHPIEERRVAHILLAEDDAAERGLVARALAADGHQVTEAENGQVALQRFTASPGSFSVLVTDVEMPELDGIALAEHVLAIRPGLK